MMKHRLLKILAYTLLAVLVFVMLLVGAAGYLCGTTHGMRFIIKTVNENLAEYVSITADIKEGSIFKGFSTDSYFEVDVKDIVTISADNLNIKYSVLGFLTRGVFEVTTLSADKLEVKLADFEDNDTVEDSTSYDEPFRLDFYTKIKVDSLVLKDFAYLSSIIDVRVPKASLVLNAYDDYAQVSKGTVEDVSVHLKLDDSESPPNNLPKILTFDNGNGAIEKFPTIDLPLTAALYNFKIINGRYYQDGYDTGLVNATVNAMFEHTLLTVYSLEASHALGQVVASGTMDFVDYYNMDFVLLGKGYTTEYNLKNYESLLFGLSGSVKVKGSLVDLGMEAKVDAPYLVDAQGRLNVLSNEIPCYLKVTSPYFTYPVIKSENLEKKSQKVFDSEYLRGISASLNKTKTAIAEELSKSVNTAVEQTKAQRNASKHDGAEDSKEQPLADAEPLKTSTKDKAHAAAAEPDITVSSEVPEHAAVHAEDKHQRTGVESKTESNRESESDSLSFRNVEMLLEGAIFEKMQLKLGTLLNGYGFNKLNIKLDSALDLSTVQVNELKIDGYLGDRKFNGQVGGMLTYSPDFDFHGKVSLKADDMQALYAPLAGAMNVELEGKVAFSYDDPRWAHLDVPTLKASFFYHQKPVNIDVKHIVSNGDETVVIDELTLQQAENLVVVSGTLGEYSDLFGKFTIEHLEYLEPTLKGDLKGRLTLQGPLLDAHLSVMSRSHRLLVNDLFIAHLVVNGESDIGAKSVSLSMMTGGIFLNRKALYGKCSLNLNGTMASHVLSFGCTSNGGSYLNIEGGFDENKEFYHGSIKSLLLATPLIDPISLIDEVSFSYDFVKKHASVSSIALTDNKATLRVSEINFNNGDLNCSAALHDVSLRNMQKYIGEEIKVSGILNIDINFIMKNYVPKFDVEASVNHGFASLYSTFIPVSELSLKINADENRLKSLLLLKLSRDNGDLRLETEVSDPYDTRKLSGKIALTNLHLDLFTAVSKQLNTLDGTLNISGTFGGTLASPLFFGEIVSKGSAEPTLSIGFVDDFDFSLKANGNNGILKGTVKLNEHPVEISGNLDWSESAAGKLSVKSERLPVFLLTYGESLVNIDTQCELGEIMSVTGKVEIPKATIRFNSMENRVIAPSKDEIFIGSDSNLRGIIVDKKKASTLNNDMKLDISVTLGEDVKVNAMGLKSDIVGGIEIKKESTSPKIMSSGKISLENGYAEMYGHKFIVNEANAVFKNDIANPKLYAEIVVDPSSLEDNILAGLRVSGYVETPEIALFSKPTMSKNEIMSYILYGHGLEHSDKENADATSQLLMSIGLGTTAGLLNSMVGVFGMEGVQIGSSGSGTNTKMEVHAFVTKKLRLSYGYGIYNSVYEVKVRYELLRKLYLELVSSLEQSADLIYSFDVD